MPSTRGTHSVRLVEYISTGSIILGVLALMCAALYSLSWIRVGGNGPLSPVVIPAGILGASLIASGLGGRWALHADSK
ncbi:hypothetical protein AXF14_02265 [Actinomyces radicidentis]|uniref:Uncharacterized protein n=1 Tax=Actinomyces radicidentis TaxID=111015 RepID=A0A0X8JD12_ACTRD|nr:hypothetical protein AXF14_02265 [Actinomyces radicidentis]